MHDHPYDHPGQPKKYNSVEELEKKVNQYFLNCDIEGKPYTMTGLAIALDMDRRSLLNYRKEAAYEKFFPIIKKARDKVEESLERKLLTDSTVTGVIFNLKNNFDWKDKQEIDASLTNTKIEVKLTDD